ncbi:hypothetical protein ACFE04_025232 [Oxalis oulophora]
MAKHVASDSNRYVFDSNTPTLPRYLVWKGNNKFCLGGRIIFGPDARSLFLTVSLILIPVILFCAFVAKRLINEFDHNRGIIIVAVLMLLLITSGRDPGIIPRNLHPPDPDDGEGSSISMDWPGSHTNGPSIPPTKDVMVNGIIVKVKYCQTCMLYRPPRCSHCSICNNCVERFDHHCPWVGQCIGKTTYENFRYRYDRKRNPYNRGCFSNIAEIFFSKIPMSRNNFREKVKVNSSSMFASTKSMGSMGRVPSVSQVPVSPKTPKRSFDIEMGKRQAVGAEDFQDLHNQIDRFGDGERGEARPSHTTRVQKNNCEITSDMQMVASELGMAHGPTDRQRIHGRN